MKRELLNFRILLAAAVMCGLLASLSLKSSATRAFDLSGNGHLAALGLIETDPDSIPVIAREQAERTALPPTKTPTLGCCNCLGGTNTLDLSTISSNNWIVTDPNSFSSPVVVVSPIHWAWNLNPGLAKWVSTVASGGTSNIGAGPYQYKLAFVVLACAIEQSVTLTGNYGGDDDVSVFLDNTTGANLLSSCSGGWCFNTSNPPPPFSRLVGPGPHTLIVNVQNSGRSPSGMFINAKLTGTCCSLTTGQSLDPDFQLTATNPLGNVTTYQLSAASASLPSGAGFWWQVEEVDLPTGNVLPNTTVTNPAPWWANPTTNLFLGYNGTSALGNTSNIGVFQQGHKYRISRGVWSSCNPWTAISKTVFMCTSCRAIEVKGDTHTTARPVILKSTLDPTGGT